MRPRSDADVATGLSPCRSGRRPGIAAIAIVLALSPGESEATFKRGRVEPGPSSSPSLSVPLGTLPVRPEASLFAEKGEDRFNPYESEADEGRRGTWSRGATPRDPLASEGFNAGHQTPALQLSFEGTGNPAGCGTCSPPDPIGDVGPHHYVQAVNATKIAVYDKSGALLGGPFDLAEFWTSGTCAFSYTDPVVAYDPLADRWILAQIRSPNTLCFAVSQGGDPLGEYYLYEFTTEHFPDYFKVGVWIDGYYVSTNEESGIDKNYNAWVLERDKMLAGLVATSQKASGEALNFLLPADIDGAKPPLPGSPELLYTFLDDAFHGGADRLELWEFQVDWSTPENSSFVQVASPAVAAFTFTVCGFFNFNCAPQPDTTRKLDVVSEWPMVRFAYRNFGPYAAAVGTFTVDAGAQRSAPRWFELRDSGSGWALYQEGTYDPGTHHRFMGSIAQDSRGDVALGYSASSASLSPAIRYATRLASDPSGTLGSEVDLQSGGGSQTGSNRWGDYSLLSIDPVDDCTFWYTNEYYATSSATDWKTRIGAFRIPECTTLFLDDFETGGTTRWSQVGG